MWGSKVPMFQSFIRKNRSEYYLVPMYFSRKTSWCSNIFLNPFSMFQWFIWNNFIPTYWVVTSGVVGKVCMGTSWLRFGWRISMVVRWGSVTWRQTTFTSMWTSVWVLVGGKCEWLVFHISSRKVVFHTCIWKVVFHTSSIKGWFATPTLLTWWFSTLMSVRCLFVLI